MRSILLHVQLQIAARRRRYDDAATERLFDLFGQPERWGSTLRTLPWARLTQVVPGFSGSTDVDLPLPCTYDFEVVAARYLDALRDGEVPLELLFSGTVFYTGEQGRLQTAQIAWDLEAEYRLPVSSGGDHGPLLPRADLAAAAARVVRGGSSATARVGA